MTDRDCKKPSLGESEERTNARTLLDEFLSLSNELGMRRLMERVLSRLDILKAR